MIRSKKTTLPALLAMALTSISCTVAAQTPPTITTPPSSQTAQGSELASLISVQLQSGAKIQIGATAIDTTQLKELYALRSYRPFFVGKSGPSQLGVSLRAILTELSEDRGLLASYYWTPDIETRWTKMDQTSRLELEILLANSYLQYAKDVSTGRTNPEDPTQNLKDIELKKRSLKDLTYLNNIASGDENALVIGLEELDPPHPAYRKLIGLLGRYRRIGAAEFAPIQGKTLQPYDSDPVAVPRIRRRLYDLGLIKDPKERYNMNPQYTDPMIQAVIWLQVAQKLEVDGIIGKGTYAALNVPLEARTEQIRANLERWRLMPRSLGDHYAFVDLGRQTLEVWKNNQLSLYMKVVVGQELRQTPTFVDQATSVIVNPYWHAPTSIVVKDILPKVLQDPYYFERLHMRVFKNKVEIDPHTVDWSKYSLKNPPPFTFREDPGDHNSLGRVKIDLSENHHAIYMHDTNAKHLFEQEKRTYSSGCIRLERPFEFAEYLLRDQGVTIWDLEALRDDPTVVAKRIKLQSPLKVYIVGTTIAVDAQDVVRWGVDIYKQDKRILAAMDGVRVNADGSPMTPAPAPAE